jgi:outer membrane protein
MLLVPLLVTSALTLAQNSHADTLGLRAGVEYWNADLSGEAQSRAARIKKTGKPVKFDDWQFYGETYNSVWVNLEHPIPFVPNIRMTYTNIENAKSRSVRYASGSIYYIRTESVALTFDNIDFTFYYEVLDNWLNLDVGLTARALNGDFEALSVTPGPIQITAPNQDRTKLNEVVPMLYLNGRFDIPFADGLYVQSVINGATLKGNTLYDADLRVGYDFDLIALDVGIYGGYRRMALKSTDLGNLYADAYMDGLIAGLEVHF